MYIQQKQLEKLKKESTPNKVVVIYGPRRCGKTTLLKKFIEYSADYIGDSYIFATAEDIIVNEILTSQSIVKLKNFIGNNKFLIIDEAQNIKNIGLNLKLIVDHIDGINVIATGSSSFDLAGKLGEPLTGRKVSLKLFPLSQMEISSIEKGADSLSNLENRLIYGSYPEVVVTEYNHKKEKYLKEITASYLYKDILILEGIKHSDKIVRLLQLLAFQIGQEVSLTELGTQLGISKNTVERYLDLLEKSFVVFKLMAFSRNLRKEISKSNRYYFYDNGIRNALINNFNPINLRNDIGSLWENYIIIERLKKQEYMDIFSNNYFWRTYDKKEIDFIEERSGYLYGYEIKWGNRTKKVPKDWINAYENASYEVINKENYLNFIT